MKLLVRSLVVLSGLLLITSCAEQQSSTASLPTQDLFNDQIQLMSSENLTVVDEAGLPIVDAKILIGYAPGNPFEGNELTTGAAGTANIPAGWSSTLPVSVQAEGYVTTTIPAANPGVLTLQMARQEQANEFEVAGTATDFGRLVSDGKVDFALVIPALNHENLLAFDLSTVISPKVDTIEVLGREIGLPSNISLPRQRESYIFPIELNKPSYRVFLRSPGEHVISATHGQFPFQRVVNDIRGGKTMFEVINHFTFLGNGQTKVDVQDSVGDKDIAVNQTRFNSQFAVRAPAFPEGQEMVSLALVEQEDRLIPTDLKRLNPNQSMNLKSFSGNGLASAFSFLVEAAKDIFADANQPFSWFKPLLMNDRRARTFAATAQDFTKMSFAILSATKGVAPTFLPLIEKPTLTDDVLSLDRPEVTQGLVAVATYLVFSEIETITTGNVISERRTRLWEIWGDQWLSEVELPKISFNKRQDRKYRWDVMFMARPANFVDAGSPTSRVDLKTITHVTRNALDI